MIHDDYEKKIQQLQKAPALQIHENASLRARCSPKLYYRPSRAGLQ